MLEANVPDRAAYEVVVVMRRLYISGYRRPYRGLYFEILGGGGILPVYSAYPNTYIYRVQENNLLDLIVPLTSYCWLEINTFKDHPFTKHNSIYYFLPPTIYTLKGDPKYLYLLYDNKIKELGVKKKSSQTEIQLMKTFM